MELTDTPDGVLLRHIGPLVPRRDARGLAVVELGRPVTNGEGVAAVTADRESRDVLSYPGRS